MRKTALRLLLLVALLYSASSADASPLNACAKLAGVRPAQVSATRAALRRSVPPAVWRGLESNGYFICGAFRTNDGRLGAAAFHFPIPPVGSVFRVRTLFEGKTLREASAIEDEARRNPSAFLRDFLGGVGTSGTHIIAVNHVGRFWIIVTTSGTRL